MEEKISDRVQSMMNARFVRKHIPSNLVLPQMYFGCVVYSTGRSQNVIL